MYWLLYMRQKFQILLVARIIVLLALLFCPYSFLQAEDSSNGSVYGPVNLLKALPTPFTTSLSDQGDSQSSSGEDISLEPIGISLPSLNKNSLEERFHGPKLFLPSRMALGQCSEFVIKGNPGSYTAIAMSESNKGAKVLYGHKLRLGADRKLVAVGKIPESGILSIFIETPIQGDLVGGFLYFEGVVWSKPNFSDLQMTSAIRTTQDSTEENGILISAQPEEKKERAIVFDLSKPMSMKNLGGLNSGKP